MTKALIAARPVFIIEQFKMINTNELNARHQLLSYNRNKIQRIKGNSPKTIDTALKHRPTLTSCASKWGKRMQQAPQKSGVINAFTIPWTWCRGRTWRMTSVLFHSHISIIPCIWLSRLPNVCTTPYGNTLHQISTNTTSYSHCSIRNYMKLSQRSWIYHFRLSLEHDSNSKQNTREVHFQLKI